MKSPSTKLKVASGLPSALPVTKSCQQSSKQCQPRDSTILCRCFTLVYFQILEVHHEVLLLKPYFLQPHSNPGILIIAILDCNAQKKLMTRILNIAHPLQIYKRQVVRLKSTGFKIERYLVQDLKQCRVLRHSHRYFLFSPYFLQALQPRSLDHSTHLA